MNLYLIGFRGSGKSSVAPILAKSLLWEFVDTDKQVEILTGKTIAQIFEEEGETGFREWETSVIQGFAVKNEQIISLGGGAPTVAANRDAIRKSGHAVWLTASIDVLWRRIHYDPSTKTNRPSLTDLDGLAEIELLLKQRAEVYNACADYTVDTTNLTPEQVADHIANWWDPVDT